MTTQQLPAPNKLMSYAVLRRLWDFGHFRNPKYPDTHTVNEVDLKHLSLTDPRISQAVKSFQEIDANYKIIGLANLGRESLPDGDFGPISNELMNLKRCGCPDYGLTARDESNYGGWPTPGCDLTDPRIINKNEFSIRVNLDTSRIPSRIKEYLNQALEACVECYRLIGIRLRYVLDGNPNESEISKKFESLGGSVIGWNEFPNSNTCNQTIDGRLDTGYTPSDWRYFANLETHETGHGVGLEHTRGGIMNPSILLIWPLTFVGDPSYNAIKRMYPPATEIPKFGVIPPPPPPVNKLIGKISADLFSDGTISGKIVYESIPTDPGTTTPNSPTGPF